MDGIQVLAAGISQEVQRPLPGQRKTQRANLALLVATMLDVRSANRMDALSVDRAGPEESLDRPGRGDGAVRPRGAGPLAAQGQPLVLILDQCKLNARHQVPMLAVRHGVRNAAGPANWPRSGCSPWKTCA